MPPAAPGRPPPPLRLCGPSRPALSTPRSKPLRVPRAAGLRPLAGSLRPPPPVSPVPLLARWFGRGRSGGRWTGSSGAGGGLAPQAPPLRRLAALLSAGPTRARRPARLRPAAPWGPLLRWLLLSLPRRGRPGRKGPSCLKPPPSCPAASLGSLRIRAACLRQAGSLAVLAMPLEAWCRPERTAPGPGQAHLSPSAGSSGWCPRPCRACLRALPPWWLKRPRRPPRAGWLLASSHAGSAWPAARRMPPRHRAWPRTPWPLAEPLGCWP